MGASKSKASHRHGPRPRPAAAAATLTHAMDTRNATAATAAGHAQEGPAVTDPDMEEERRVLEALAVGPSSSAAARSSTRAGGGKPAPFRFIPLGMRGNTFVGNSDTAQLLAEVGGVDALKRGLDLFYAKMFADPHLDQFVHTQTDPHAQRLANWLAEKMDSSKPVWSLERQARSKCPVSRLLAGIGAHVVHDRSSAHAAAWHSPKRSADVIGQHFKLHDARNWMRLNFWAMREAGLFDQSPTFASWYVRFIAHFVRVYESTAPQFARESARWSADPRNIELYANSGNRMPASVLGSDGRGVPARQATADLLAKERESSAGSWPYGNAEED